MGAPLGSGRNDSYFFIGGLRKSEVEVLKLMMNLPKGVKPTIETLAMRLNVSYTTVYFGMKHLLSRGIVHRSPDASWHIRSGVKSELIAASTQPSSTEEVEDSSAQTSLE